MYYFLNKAKQINNFIIYFYLIFCYCYITFIVTSYVHNFISCTFLFINKIILKLVKHPRTLIATSTKWINIKETKILSNFDYLLLLPTSQVYMREKKFLTFIKFVLIRYSSAFNLYHAYNNNNNKTKLLDSIPPSSVSNSIKIAINKNELNSYMAQPGPVYTYSQ